MLSSSNTVPVGARRASIFALLFTPLLFALSATPVLSEQAAVLVPVFTPVGSSPLLREGDNVRVDVGSPFLISCGLADANGITVAQLPSGAPLSDAAPVLSLTRGPENGLIGRLDASGAPVRLKIAGLYIFLCKPGNPAAFGDLDTPVRVANARSISIGSSEASLTNPASMETVARFEVGRAIDVHAKVFSSSAPSRAVRPSSVSVLFREGHVGCETDSAQANSAFNFQTPRQWTATRGIVQQFTAQRQGQFTAIVTQLDGQGGVRCDALPLTVLDDLFPPEITLRFPDQTHQMLWSRDTLRVSGRVRDSGSGISSVIVSNGHWSENARLIDLVGTDDMTFVADLPFARGLQILTVTATDATGRTSRFMESLYVGENFAKIRTGAPEIGSFYAVRLLRVQAGRSLVRNNTPGIDSLSEIVGFAPEILSILDVSGENTDLQPEVINQDEDQAFIFNGGNLFIPDFKIRGTLVPGQLNVSLSNGTIANTLGSSYNLLVGIPFTGNVLITCDGVSFGWEHVLCTFGGAPSGEFDVVIGGQVLVTIPVQVTTVGGTAIYFLPHDITIENRLQITNGLSNNNEINEKFAELITTGVEEKIQLLIWEQWGCPEEDGVIPVECSPVPPLVTDTVDIDRPNRPEMVGILLNDGDGLFTLNASLPSLFGDVDLPALFVIDPDEASISRGRLDLMLSTSLSFEDATDHEGILGALLDAGTLVAGQEHFLTPPDLLPIFGTGNHDVQALFHLNLINELAAQYWATGAMNYRANLYDVLSAAGFFEGDPLGDAVARGAFAKADLVVEIGAPPRVTSYDGTHGLFVEVGDIKLTLDLTEEFGSSLEFEGALSSRLSLESTGTGLRLKLADPTGCMPNEHIFMACNGRFELGLRQVTGFTSDSARPQTLRDDAFYIEFLKRLGLRKGDGTAASADEVEKFYSDAFAEAISTVLQDSYTFDFPTIPLPRINFGRLQIAPLEIRDLVLHQSRDGGRPAQGWIGLEFNIRSILE